MSEIEDLKKEVQALKRSIEPSWLCPSLHWGIFVVI